MDKWIPLTIVALVLACIRVLVIIGSSVSMILLAGMQYGQLGNLFYYVNSTLHIFILLFLALGLNIIKESIWSSIAYVVYALMSIPFIVLGILHISDTKIWSTFSAINVIIIVLFTVQSFLVKDNKVKGAFRGYSIILLFILITSMAIPLLASVLALPMHYVQFTSVMYLIPGVFEIYMIYLFYQYFTTPVISPNDGFINHL